MRSLVILSWSVSTGPKQPDLRLTLNGVCVFRGEKTAAGSSTDIPRRTLGDPLTWRYDKVPYQFASGPKIKLYALVYEKASAMATVEIGSYDLRGLGGCLRLLLPLLNGSRTFKCIAENFADSMRHEFENYTQATVMVSRRLADGDYRMNHRTLDGISQPTLPESRRCAQSLSAGPTSNPIKGFHLKKNMQQIHVHRH